MKHIERTSLLDLVTSVVVAVLTSSIISIAALEDVKSDALKAVVAIILKSTINTLLRGLAWRPRDHLTPRDKKRLNRSARFG